MFFKALLIVSLLTGTSNSTLAFSSSRRSAHLECPSGTGPQAISISLASARPSTLRFALSELMQHIDASSIIHYFFKNSLGVIAGTAEPEKSLVFLVRI